MDIPEIVYRTYDKLILDDGGKQRLLLSVGNGDSKCSALFERDEVVKLRADLQRWLDHIDSLS